MSQENMFAYRGPGWRGRAVLLIALSVFASSILALIALIVSAFSELSQSSDEVMGLLCGLVLGVGVLALIIWQVVLTACNILVTTADLYLEPDALTLIMMGCWSTSVAREDIRGYDHLHVVYRLGKAVRIKGSFLRPWRRKPTAYFVPVIQVSRLRFVFWAVARMYAGRHARFGFLVTPDHEQSERLLATLRESGSQL